MISYSILAKHLTFFNSIQEIELYNTGYGSLQEIYSTRFPEINIFFEISGENVSNKSYKSTIIVGVTILLGAVLGKSTIIIKWHLWMVDFLKIIKIRTTFNYYYVYYSGDKTVQLNCNCTSEGSLKLASNWILLKNCSVNQNTYYQHTNGRNIITNFSHNFVFTFSAKLSTFWLCPLLGF